MSTETIQRSELSGTYTIDAAHSTLGFVARHAMVTKVRGAFNEFTGTFTVDAEDPGSASAEVTIEAASIDTRNADRDGHLKSNDFFAMEEYPQLTFRSTKVEPKSDSEFRVTGDLTIRGVTKEITFDLDYTGAVTDPWGMLRVGFEGRTEVNRKDWGLNWN
ncbi:MAG: YceI family protein, partial [Nitriliruptoraceae bacterium]